MAEFEVDLNDLGTPGVVLDIPGFQLPPEAWTYGHNIRFIDNVPSRISGQTQAWGTPGIAPHFLLPVSGPTQVWWLYTSLTKAYVYDASSHTEITRAAGDYTGLETREWNGTIFAGIPVLNNGTDVPQYWASYAAATDLAALPNWPATYRAKVVRAFGPQLVAFGITKGASIYPHNVLWSHTADPGTVPTSWDTVDTTKDTGEKSLEDVESGIILDAMPLRGNMYIGKENSIWRMRRIGGRFIFGFDTYLETAGVLAPRCMTNVGILGQQTIWTQDDILLHNGSGQDSILSKKWRRALFSRIDVENYLNCFSFDNAKQQEVWYCFPESGEIHPNTALIWNYGDNQLRFSTSDVNFRNVAPGIIPDPETTTWEANTDTWEVNTEFWENNDRRRLVACCTDDTMFQILDSGLTRNGSTYSATLQREGLALLGRKRDGSWIVDFKVMKMFRRIWLKASGGPINVRVGVQQVIGGSTTWGTSQMFDPNTQNYIDVILTGRALAIEISTADSVDWYLHGYKVDVVAQGNF